MISPAMDMERRILQRFIEDEGRVEMLMEELAKADMEPISELDFGSEAHRQVFLWLTGGGNGDETVLSLVNEMRSAMENLPPLKLESEAVEELLETLLRLREYRLKERLRELEGIIQEGFSDSHSTEVLEIVARLKSLQDALASYKMRSILKRSV